MSFEVKQLVKTYENQIVVDHLSFSIKESGVYALLGTNGAGKTTSIRMILGMLAKDGGEVVWDGKTMQSINKNVGYLAEERGLYQKYSLMDQLYYFAYLKGLNRSEAYKQIKSLAQRLEVEEYLFGEKKGNRGIGVKQKTPEQLSKGNQQKIQFLVALLADPKLLILDEPFSGLDPVNMDLFKTIVRQEISKGKYLILSSHQMNTIEEFCKDITILNRGKTVLQGDLNEIKKGYGRINLMIKCEEPFGDIVLEQGISVATETPDNTLLKVKDEEQAHRLLLELLKKNKRVVRFELREPSLHEIFIEKVGKSHENE